MLSTTDFTPMLEAVCRAAQLCQRVQEKQVLDVEKPGREPVTIADYGSQAILCQALTQYFPNDGVIAEEQGEHFLNALPEEQRQHVATLVGETLQNVVTAEDIVRWLDHGRGRTTQRTWVIDPIDGTKGFLAGRHYTIALGLLEGHLPVAGVLGCPGYGEGMLVYALNGEARRVPLAGGFPERIRVSMRTPKERFHVVESVEQQHAAHDVMQQIYEQAGITNPQVLRIDGQDKYALIASGDADLYLRISPKADYRERVWDHAAGVAVITAAGGTVTDKDGNQLDFSVGEKLANNMSVIVSNGRAHDHIVRVAQTVIS
ncbi:MAG: 3'-Phosphoadenosine 5'-phosphosulfate (PAPS) 3'-phosphatase [Chloroflexi bacterium AL-N1]|nr:3'-Phosphoadenosine 5'-phosphosulfate (PAPS) 3'-phosphatase [Chloroflexi bacterium AL-N1]NOK77378.1 3'-Phosphoadenosine 5'-phosphosulfate (PAPS) 3'-phosphatase [Chloroflexi bacterium AL-N5]